MTSKMSTSVRKLSEDISSLLASVRNKEKEYDSLEKFASAKDGLIRAFPLNQYAECFKLAHSV